jgi:subtilisin family serine protease
MDGETGAGSARSHSALQGRRLTRIADRTDIAVNPTPGQDYLYRPHELLVAVDDLPLVNAEIVALHPERRERLTDLGIVRFVLPPAVDIPALVTRLRASNPSRVPRVGPNHLLPGEPAYQGGPVGAATPSPRTIDFRAGAGARIRVAVLDTGIARGVNRWLDARCVATANDAEELDVLPADGFLDDEAGHGTFVAGVVLQRAPSARIDIAKVLDSEGYGDEIDVARAIARFANDDVINLSLGGYCHGDLPPLAVVHALRSVSPDSVIVAAAGNNASSRPMWPAAFKRVLAVGALDRSGKQRAPFSNHGWWVDCCVPAVGVLSSFVVFDEKGRSGDARKPRSFKGWATWSGTSFAAPKVAGEVAALRTTTKAANARAAALALFAGRRWLPDLGVVLNL